MAEIIGNSRNTADAIIVGGGSVGLHTANALYDEMGKNARILAVTQESEWGGIAGRSLEQYRLFNDSYALAEIVDKGVSLYRQLDEELRETKTGERAYEQFPYVFTVGADTRPDYISDLLPENTPDRPSIDYYRKLRDDTKSWGFDPDAREMTADELRQRFPVLDGDGIESAMVVENAGRLHFDIMRNWLVNRTRANSDGRGVTFRARTAAREILLGKDGAAIGVDLNGEKVYSDTIILALGSFVVNLAQLVPGNESRRLASGFTVIQRELFFANMPGVPDNTNLFLVSPDMAIARLSTREGHASYGYAAEDDPIITSPVIDHRPNDEYVADYQINRKELFVGRTYTMFGECSTRWDSDKIEPGRPNMAIEPFGYSAGSYTSYKDGLPVVGKIGDTNVILAAGSHHSGIMGGHGIAELVTDHATSRTPVISETTRQQTDINRTPVEHAGLVL